MRAERRHFPRYSVQPNKFVVFCHDSLMTANIKDISQGGLRFEYFPSNGDKAEWKMVDILHQEKTRFYLPDLACNIIYDVLNLEENRSFSGSQSRVCGLKFERLTTRQENKLEDLLKTELTRSATDFL